MAVLFSVTKRGNNPAVSRVMHGETESGPSARRVPLSLGEEGSSEARYDTGAPRRRR